MHNHLQNTFFKHFSDNFVKCLLPLWAASINAHRKRCHLFHRFLRKAKLIGLKNKSWLYQKFGRLLQNTKQEALKIPGWRPLLKVKSCSSNARLTWLISARISSHNGSHEQGSSANIPEALRVIHKLPVHFQFFEICFFEVCLRSTWCKKIWWGCIIYRLAICQKVWGYHVALIVQSTRFVGETTCEPLRHDFPALMSHLSLALEDSVLHLGVFNASCLLFWRNLSNSW